MLYALVVALFGVAVFWGRRTPMQPSFDWERVRLEATLFAHKRLNSYDSDRAIRWAEYERNWKREWEDQRRRKMMHVVK